MHSGCKFSILNKGDDLWCNCESPGDSLQCCCDFCGCGSEAVGDLLLEVLRWCAVPIGERPKEDGGCYRSAAWELAAKVLDRAGLVEHGTGIGWPWLTPDGAKFLEWVKQNDRPESA